MKPVDTKVLFYLPPHFTNILYIVPLVDTKRLFHIAQPSANTPVYPFVLWVRTLGRTENSPVRIKSGYPPSRTKTCGILAHDNGYLKAYPSVLLAMGSNNPDTSQVPLG